MNAAPWYVPYTLFDEQDDIINFDNSIIIHLQSPPFKFAIRDLNWLKLFTCLNSSGKLFPKLVFLYVVVLA